LDSELLDLQISSLVRATRAISTLGLPLDNKLIAFRIVSSLPSSLSTLKAILSTSKPSDLTTEYVKSQIDLDEQGRMRHCGMESVAYFAKAAKKGKDKNKQRDKEGKYCTYCKWSGHDVEECRKLTKEQEAKEATKAAPPSSLPSNAASANVAQLRAASPPPSKRVTHLFRDIAACLDPEIEALSSPRPRSIRPQTVIACLQPSPYREMTTYPSSMLRSWRTIRLRCRS
jgi:hypothetical protein